jgi:cobalt-zinc-cadmium resistance protein CzcA
MAQTVVLALGAATILSMTLIPALIAIVMRGRVVEREVFLFRWARSGYDRALDWSLRNRAAVLAGAVFFVVGAGYLASGLGSEFAPRLSEGALALQPARIPSTGISTSVDMQKRLEKRILEAFPDEVDTVFARTGTAEVATDPMGPNVSDTYLMLRPRDQWTQAETQEELAEAMEKVVETEIGQNYEFSQPIELRFNELISGVRSEIAVKVFGDDLDVMVENARHIAGVLQTVPGAADVQVEQVTGLPVLTIDIDRRAISRYGLNVQDVQVVVEAAVGGLTVGEIFEGDMRFDLVVRLPDRIRRDVEAIENLPIPLPRDAHEHRQLGPTMPANDAMMGFVPLAAVADIAIVEGPNRISREDAKRRVVVQCNVRGRDLGSFVDEAQRRMDDELKLPPGYWLEWGGQFENLIAARERLLVVVPVALLLIMGLLFLSFGTVKNALLIFSGVPLALTGGIAALWLRGLPITISAAVGFIALSGVAVLNGLVMVTFIENLRRERESLAEAIHIGSVQRLRPVMMTALVASLGFVPMAVATGTGAEVQRPLATVVIGGIISSTILTLFVLPILYRVFHREDDLPGEDDGPPSSLSWRPPPIAGARTVAEDAVDPLPSEEP